MATPYSLFLEGNRVNVFSRNVQSESAGRFVMPAAEVQPLLWMISPPLRLLKPLVLM